MSDLNVLEKELRRRVRNFDKKYSLAQARLAVALEIAKERESAGLSQKAQRCGHPREENMVVARCRTPWSPSRK